MFNKWKLSLASSIAMGLLCGCTQGPDIGKLDEQALRKINDQVQIDIYTLGSNSLENWSNDKQAFELKLQNLKQLNGNDKLKAVHDLADVIGIKDIENLDIEFEFDSWKKTLEEVYRSKLNSAVEVLENEKKWLAKFIKENYKPSLDAVTKRDADLEQLKQDYAVFESPYESAVADAIASLESVGLSTDKDNGRTIARAIYNRKDYDVYSYDYSDKIKDKTCQQLDNRSSTYAKNYFYSDAFANEAKSEIYCVRIHLYNSHMRKNVDKLESKQHKAITTALNKAYELFVLAAPILEQHNNYSRERPELTKLAKRHSRDKSTLKRYEDNVAIRQQAVDSNQIPSDEELTRETITNMATYLERFTNYHEYNLLLNELDYVSTVGSDGRFKLDNTEDYNMLIMYEKRVMNRRAEFQVIRLAEYADQPVVVVGNNGMLRAEDLKSVSL